MMGNEDSRVYLAHSKKRFLYLHGNRIGIESMRHSEILFKLVDRCIITKFHRCVRETPFIKTGTQSEDYIR